MTHVEEQFVGTMLPILDEKQHRLFLGAYSKCLGYGGVKELSALTRVSRTTITQGKEETKRDVNVQANPSKSETGRIRARGAGRKTIEQERYPAAGKLYITADGGGSNGRRNRLWKINLQHLADETGLEIHVSHFPPGTSKWNKIEHRLFSFIRACLINRFGWRDGDLFRQMAQKPQGILCGFPRIFGTYDGKRRCPDAKGDFSNKPQ